MRTLARYRKPVLIAAALAAIGAATSGAVAVAATASPATGHSGPTVTLVEVPGAKLPQHVTPAVGRAIPGVPVHIVGPQGVTKMAPQGVTK